ncbi:MAG: excisionase family DNA-binding protein [Brevundimonas sp.]
MALIVRTTNAKGRFRKLRPDCATTAASAGQRDSRIRIFVGAPSDLRNLTEREGVSNISFVAIISNISYVPKPPERPKMTMPAFAEELGDRLPSANERAAANQLRQILAAQATSDTDQRLRVLDETGKPAEIILAPALSRLLMELLRYVGKGDAVTLVPVSQMLTTQQAADILNVSRPFFVSLLEKGDIEHVTVGRHRRVKAENLFAYKKARDAQRSAALSELAEMDAEHL